MKAACFKFYAYLCKQNYANYLHLPSLLLLELQTHSPQGSTVFFGGPLWPPSLVSWGPPGADIPSCRSLPTNFQYQKDGINRAWYVFPLTYCLWRLCHLFSLYIMKYSSGFPFWLVHFGFFLFNLCLLQGHEDPPLSLLKALLSCLSHVYLASIWTWSGMVWSRD